MRHTSNSIGDVRNYFSGLRFAFFGTGEFAVPALEKFISLGARPLAVITSPDAPAGRDRALAPPPVKTAAEHAASDPAHPPLPILQPHKLDDAFLHHIKSLKPVVAVLADYGKIVPQKVIDAFPRGILNIHPSLLPLYRGATPIEAAILSGDEITGVSIILIDAQLDHGPIVVQRTTRVRDGETSKDLRMRLARLGGDTIIRILPRYMDGKIVPQEQDHAKATITRMLDRDEGHLVFAEGAAQLARMVRAFTPWPGTYAIWRRDGIERRIKILEADTDNAIPQKPENYSGPDTAEEKPLGTAIKLNSCIGILTANGILAVRTLQLEGKRPQHAMEFLNGYPEFIGAVLS